jgi:hypothetical protein
VKKIAGIILTACTVLALSAPPGFADHDGYGDGGDGDRYEHDYGGEDSNKKCNGARDNCSDNDFSPTFDKSPVDIHDNQFCVMPGSCSAQPGGDEKKPS